MYACGCRTVVEPNKIAEECHVPRQFFTEVSCVVCVCGIGTGSLENKEALFRRPLPPSLATVPPAPPPQPSLAVRYLLPPLPLLIIIATFTKS